MGSIFLQVGQCGCQIGSKLNPLLSNSYYCTRTAKPNRLHAIMIDSQPKVLQPFLQKPPIWLDSKNIKFFDHGRGNNWSYGYLNEIPQKIINKQIMADHRQFSNKNKEKMLMNYVHQNKKISEFVIQRFRKEFQTVDCALVINSIGSLGGGTGSGVGTKLVQILHEQFNIDIYSHCVLPNMSGQTPLQIYNCLLSLSVLQQNSKAIFPIQNQKQLQYFCLQNTEYFQTSSLDQINQDIANNLSKFFKINDIPGYDRFYSNIISQLTLSQKMKYFSILSSDSQSQIVQDRWNECFQDIYKKLKIYNQDFSNPQTIVQKIKREKLLAGQLISIGKEQPSQELKYKKKINGYVNPAQENSLQISFIPAKGTHINSLINNDKNTTIPNKKNNKTQLMNKSQKQRNQLLLIMNHSNILRYLQYLCNRGRIKFENNAYLWHYQYVDIQQAIQNVQKTIDQYQFIAHGKN